MHISKVCVLFQKVQTWYVWNIFKCYPTTETIYVEILIQYYQVVVMLFIIIHNSSLQTGRDWLLGLIPRPHWLLLVGLPGPSCGLALNWDCSCLTAMSVFSVCVFADAAQTYLVSALSSVVLDKCRAPPWMLSAFDKVKVKWNFEYWNYTKAKFCKMSSDQYNNGVSGQILNIPQFISQSQRASVSTEHEVFGVILNDFFSQLAVWVSKNRET